MPRSSINDTAAIASAVCQIAKQVLVPAQAAPKGPTRPWPTQVRRPLAEEDEAVEPLAADAPSTPPPQRKKSAPWSTQIRAAQMAAPSSAEASQDRGEIDTAAATSQQPDLSLPPRAPDGSYTEMKVINPGTSLPKQGPPLGVQSASPLQADDERRAPMLRKLDAGLQGYYGEAAAQETGAADSPVTQDVETISNVAPADDTVTDVRAMPLASTAPLEPIEVPPTVEAMTLADVSSTRAQDTASLDAEEYDATTEVRETPLRAAKVPSSRLGRLFHYGGLGAGLAFGAAGSLFRGSQQNNIFMSKQNISRLVDKLSTMRGAALKLGQFLSIQDTKLLPPQIEKVLLRVQNSANYMPVWQMNQVMTKELGEGWREKYFETFEEVPFASASIGQVHSATLRSDLEGEQMAGKRVAVKIQFPGVLESIDSDLSYIRWLVSASALLPKGLFLDNTLRVMSRELRDECDYTREAEMGRRFGDLMAESSEFEVPRIVSSLSTGKVLVSEMMRGRPLTQASRYSQSTRDSIATSILSLSLSELFRYRLMQTDPNWTNFLYNEKSGKIQLIDFGATREYSKAFMDDWLRMLQAAVRGEREECISWSRKVGYLTGEESEAMETAHVQSMIALGEPFRAETRQPFPFEDQTITDRVKEHIPLMLRERLTPPPEETYSLNRKLSGAFLLCARLRANVDCRKMFEEVQSSYMFGPVESAAATARFGEDKRAYHTAPRREGRNLADRFPRSKVVLREVPADVVETLSSGTVAPMEGPADVKDGDLSRSMIPAEKEAEPKAKVIGPTAIRGITIPLKPPPPGAEECCMSGCAHCTYDIYAEDLEHFHSSLQTVREKLLALSPPVSKDEWREDLLGAMPTPGEGKRDEDLREKAEKEVDQVIGDLDPTMKAFLEMERRMKKKDRLRRKDAK